MSRVVGVLLQPLLLLNKTVTYFHNSSQKCIVHHIFNSLKNLTIVYTYEQLLAVYLRPLFPAYVCQTFELYCLNTQLQVGKVLQDLQTKLSQPAGM